MMRIHLVPSLIISVLVSAGCETGQPRAPSRVLPDPKGPIYRPPPDDQPGGRRFGGPTRGANEFLVVLLPEQRALTTSGRPKLYWYVPRADVPAHCQISILDETKPVGSPQRMVFQTAPEGFAVASPGIQKLDLAAESQCRALQPGVTYQWRVDLLPREKNVCAGGYVTRVPLPAGLQGKLASRDTGAVARAYAGADPGIWVEAVSVIMDGLELNPNDAPLQTLLATMLREQRIDLATQPGALARGR